LNTSKNLAEIEKIVKDLGMHIILKVGMAYLDFKELSKEETATWVNSLDT